MEKLTPHQLVESWNALSETLKISENMADKEFTTQAKRVVGNLSIRNEIDYWNQLTPQERDHLKAKGMELEIDFQKIDVAPKSYPNDLIKPLQRFIKPELKKKQTQIEKLLEEKE